VRFELLFGIAHRGTFVPTHGLLNGPNKFTSKTNRLAIGDGVMERDRINTQSVTDATVTRRGGMHEEMEVKGKYIAECYGPDGELKWQDTIDNVVCTVGKDLMFDSSLAGSAYTVVGPFMGLISSVNYAAGPAASDTMANHPGWTEAGGANAPTYTAPRMTCVWSAASAGSKALSAALTFAITGTGTVKGSFIVTGTGALSTIDDTNGVLWSAGLFTGGDKPVAANDTINISYSVSA
jgi:hypothetical protein